MLQASSTTRGTPVPKLHDFSHGDLSIAVSDGYGDDIIRLDWRGKSNARQPGTVLQPFFQGLLASAQRADASVEMHFEGIDHFNSSTITALIQLLQKLRLQHTKLVLHYDPALKWQKLSFDALRVFQKPDGMLDIQEASSGAP